MNTDELALEIYRAERRVLEIQAKLHLWRARCAVRRTPGSGGGSGRPTSGNTDRALRADLTVVSENVEEVD